MSPNPGVITGGWPKNLGFFPRTPTTLPCACCHFIRFTKSIFHRGLIAGIVVLLASCATTDNPDPYEGMNRRVMAFNDGADRMILKPISKGYMNITSPPVRSSVTNFYDNFGYPITIINQLLQGKFKLGFSDTGRFLTNSTLGLLGFFDVATDFGMEYHDEDFGQTLGVWGVGSGAYLVIPLWGPVTTRSGVGDIASFYTHPVQYIDDNAIAYGLFFGWAIQTRTSLLDAEDLITGDRYLFIRDAYLQRREFLVNDGEIEEDPFFDDIE
jgi:phospholipid-binding lipoprotein MlaA